MLISLTFGLKRAPTSHNTREFGRIDGLKLEDWET
jgi:hypothetical protein